jgi:hypothetical protein
MDRIYTVDGYEYHIFEDREEDNIKFFHECYKDGKRVTMPNEFYQHSPYSRVPQDKFREYIRSLEVFIQG